MPLLRVVTQSETKPIVFKAKRHIVHAGGALSLIRETGNKIPNPQNPSGPQLDEEEPIATYAAGEWISVETTDSRES